MRTRPQSFKQRITRRQWLAASALVTAAIAPASLGAATGPCEPVGAVDAIISVSPPARTHVVGLKLQLDYPTGVDVPGRADEASVKERVRLLPGGLLYSPNDTDGSMIVALVGTAPIAAGPLFEVKFDRCKGAPAPTAKDFHCGVEQGSDDQGALLATGLSCAVALQAHKEKP